MLCMCDVKALARLFVSTESPEPSLLINAIDTKISNAGPNMAISINLLLLESGLPPEKQWKITIQINVNSFKILNNSLFPPFYKVQCSPFITLCFGSKGNDCAISEACNYTGTILHGHFPIISL